MEKILTVSIASYNVAETLDEALIPFVECAKRDQIEVLIVDDGSKDNTAEIGKYYEDLYPETFRLIKKENGGWGSTLNAGFQYGTGKYFKQLDGDDYYSKENLEAFIDFLASTEADMVYSPFVIFNNQSGAVIRVLGVQDRIIPRTTMNLMDLHEFFPAMHTVAVKMDILKKNNIQITEHCFYTDVEFVLKAYDVCQTISFFELPIYYYRLARDGQSMSITGVRKNYKDHLKMLKTVLQYEKEHPSTKGENNSIHQRLLGVCNMQYIFFFALEPTAEHREELKAYDEFLKVNYPQYYNEVGSKPVQVLRKYGFGLYRIIGPLQTWRDKKRKINIFEGA